MSRTATRHSITVMMTRETLEEFRREAIAELGRGGRGLPGSKGRTAHGEWAPGERIRRWIHEYLADRRAQRAVGEAPPSNHRAGNGE